MTATKGSPSIRAKYASLIAVEPDDASTTVVPSVISPLHSAYRNSERARRCFSEPVGWVDSSFRYRSTSGNAGSGNATRWVSAERFASASTRRTASSIQARAARDVRSTSSTARPYRPRDGGPAQMARRRSLMTRAGTPTATQ